MTVAWLVIIAIHGTLLVLGENTAAFRSHYCARSIDDLRELAQVDVETVKRLKLLDDDPSTPPALSGVIQTYVEDFLDSSFINNLEDESQLARHIDATIENPIAIFRLMQRVILLLQDLETIPEHSLHQSLGRFSNLSQVELDLDEVAAGLERIHSFYDLNITELALGKIGNVETRIRLYGSDCFVIGGMAIRAKAYASAIQWLLQANRLAKEDQTVDPIDMEVTYRHAVVKHDQELLNKNQTVLNLFSRSLGTFEMTHPEVPTLLEKLREEYSNVNPAAAHPEILVQNLCSHRNPSLAASPYLFCWLEHKIHPIYMIRPLKMEFLSRSPDIVQIHEAFNPKEMDSVIEDVRGRLKPSQDSNSSVHAGAGQSMAEVLLGPNNGSDGFPQVHESIQAMTGMSCSSGTCRGQAEKNINGHLRITHYLPGGYTGSRTDCDEQEDQSCQERFATFMIYLNDVKQGGRTVFPKTSTVSEPSKGSALLWFNTLSDCTSKDDSTEHASCPVLLGQKWTAAKWISIQLQGSSLFSQGCLLNPDERFQFPVNGKANKLLKPGRTLTRYPATRSPGPKEPELITRKFSYYSVRGLQELIELERHIFEVTPATSRGDASLSLVAMNPLKIFQTLWQFEHVVKPVLASTSHQTADEGALQRDKIMKLYDPSYGPTDEDVHVAALGLLRMQYVYDLKTQDVSRGMLAEIETDITLNPVQCIELAHRAAYHEYYTLAVEWAEEALQKVKHEGDNNNGTCNAVKLLKLAQKEVQIANITLKAHNRKIRESDSPEGNRNRYRHICQGTISQSEEEKRKLFCWLETMIHPTWTIGPLKAEWLSLTPQVVQYHDVLTQEFIHLVQQGRVYERGETVIYNRAHGGNAIDTNRKLSSVSWVPIAEGPKTKNDTARLFWDLVLRVTGKRSDMITTMQVAYYPPGGHYSVHDDLGGTTFLAYLGEPMKGGETVMLHPGLRITPKKGSAIHWHNVDSSGEKDKQTFHASCPIIFGVKQIVIGWPLYPAQAHLVCHKERHRKIEILVNGRPLNDNKA